MKMGVIFILMQLMIVSAFADDYGGGGTHPYGGGIPSLGDLANTKAELADGEVYNLSGTIVFLSDGNPYLQVDLKKYTWLQNAKRMAFPYYYLSGDAAFWRRNQGNHVTYMCIAGGGLGTTADGTPFYQIMLNPVQDSPAQSMVLDEVRGPSNSRHN